MTNSTTSKPAAKNWNKPGYIIFAALGIFYAIKQDFANACVFWNIAVVFDPFEHSKPLRNRPLYQRVWLVVHVMVGFTLLILLVAGR